MAKQQVMLITGEKKIPVELKKILDGNDITVNVVSINDFPAELHTQAPDAVIMYLATHVHEMGERILHEVQKYFDTLPVIACAESHVLEDAISLMKLGAFDYFALPLNEERFKQSLHNALRLYQLTKKVFLLESQSTVRGDADGMLGISQKMQEIFNMTRTVAKSNATVLIMGESGTGKELVAKAIHRNSQRAKKVFVDINCGAIPKELLENEMFGHEKGAFTGADRRYIGSVERAHEGTLFLDEISEMDASLQVKLLRFLQERSFTRIGGSQSLQVDVRIVAATNRNLVQEVENGRFREDLFYRLNVVPIQLPGLRERKEDIPVLTQHFLQKYSSKNDKPFHDIDAEALDALLNYDWPGNVRELENVVERVVVLNNDTQMKLKHLPTQIQQAQKKPSAASATGRWYDDANIIPLELVERYAIEAALRKCMGNVGEAAQKLQIGQATLYRKIKQYGLSLE